MKNLLGRHFKVNDVQINDDLYSLIRPEFFVPAALFSIEKSSDKTPPRGFQRPEKNGVKNRRS